MQFRGAPNAVTPDNSFDILGHCFITMKREGCHQRGEARRRTKQLLLLNVMVKGSDEHYCSVRALFLVSDRAIQDEEYE